MTLTTAVEPLEAVVALDRLVALPEEVRLLGVRVHRAREGLLEPDEVCPALDRVDVVHVAVDARAVRLVVLEGDLDDRPLALLLEVHHLRVERRLVLVEVLHELAQAALVVMLGLLAAPLVLERDGEPGVQERELAAARLDDLEVELRFLEDLAGRAGRSSWCRSSCACRPASRGRPGSPRS